MNNFEIVTLKKSEITDFALERNLLLKKTKSDWILFLDTDEKLSPELKKEMSELDPKGYSGFVIRRKIFFLGREIGEDRVLRLAKKNVGKWVRKVHETWQIRGKVGTLNGYVIHNTVDNLHGYVDKINKYSSIHAEENIREGKKFTLFKITFRYYCSRL